MFHWKRKMFADGGVLRDSGGGGGGGGQQAAQPTQSTSYNTNVPEYVRPYVENMLQSAQKQIYNDDMTTFRPYQPYSSDVNNYFADFSPTQKRAQSETANMQTPGQYGAATGMTGLAGLGSMGAGANYATQATDPRTTQAYMSPYMQNVVDYQKSQALRDYEMGQPMMQAKAVGQGAFGGNRLAIQQAEAQRGLMSQLQGLQATGTQNAFQNAQQNQQFGANLGLQGYNQAGQMGSQLANIGGQQQAADLARLQAQQTVGQQQQTMEQNKINQAISNYSTAQQYPFMQLGIMNAMLRGLPLQQTTTATYQQQPSTAQQLTGLGGAALSYLGKKEGGVIGMKEGGTVPGYKYGDLISDPQLQGISRGLSPDQNQARIADPQVNDNERNIFKSTVQGQQYVKNNPMAAQQMAQMSAPPPQMAQAPSDDARMGGIAQAGGDMFNTMGYAGGGIIAFEGGGDVPFSVLDEEGNVMPLTTAQKKEREAEKKAPVKTAAKETKAESKETTPNSREAYLAQTQALMEKQGFKPGASADEQAYADIIAKQQAGLGEATSAKERANMAKAFLKMGANPRGFLAGAIEGGESYLTGAGEIAAGREAREMTLAEARSKYSAAQRARAAGDIAASDKLFHEAAQLENQLKIAQGNNAATLGAASISAASHRAPYDLVAKEKEAVREELRTKLGREPTMTEVIAAYSTASNKTADTTIQGQIETALAKNKTYEMISLQLANPDLDPKQKEKLKAEQKAIYDDIVARISKSGSQTTAQTAEGAPMYATNGKERIVSTDGGKTWNPVKG
jgi:hypothetical protein